MQNIDKKYIHKTICEKCIFSRPAKEKKNSCSIGIFDSVKEDFNTYVSNGYNVIEKYLCSYALDKQTYDIYQEELGTLDNAKLESVKNAQIKYSLIIYTEENQDIETIRHKLGRLSELSIQHQHLQIIGKDKTMETLQNSIADISLPNTSWKCNGYIEYEHEYNMIKWALSTNNIVKSVPYVWLLHIDMIDRVLEHNIIQALHNLIVIKQIDASILSVSKHVDQIVDSSNGLFGLFTTSNFWFFSSHYREETNFEQILANVKIEYPDTEYAEYAY